MEQCRDRFADDSTQKRQEFTRILMEEIKLLNDIGRKRNETMKLAEDEKNEKLLVKLGEPVKWIGYNSNDLFDSIILFISILF